MTTHETVETRPVRVRILGPMLIEGAGCEGAQRSHLTKTLLAVLSTAAPAAVGFDAIIEALWPSDAPASRTTAARTIIWRARQHLPAEVIVTESYGGYRLDTSVCSLDHLDYVGWVERARDHLVRSDAVAALASLEQAAALWRSQPLAEWGDAPWARATIARLTELHSGAVEDHAAALATTGDLAGAISELEAACAVGPTREHAWSLLIDCLARAGRRREAARAADSARAQLATIGLEPGLELRHSVERLRAAVVVPQAGGDLLVGRDYEVQSLVGVAARALASKRAAFVLVEGEAGVGKSALVDAGVATLTSIVKVSTWLARCDRLVSLPYAPLARVAAALTSEPLDVIEQLRVATTVTPSADASQLLGQWQLHEALADLFTAAAERPGVSGLVLVVEDIQWAPASTLAALRHLVLHRSDEPIVCVATQRSGEPLDPAAAAIVADLQQSSLTTVMRLVGLTEASSTALFTSLGGRPELAPRAHTLTGGNPFYLRSLAATGDRGLGAELELVRASSLGAALDARIRVLPPEVRGVLECASVLGEEFDEALLTAVASGAGADHPAYAGTGGLSPIAVGDALRAAEAAGLLTGGVQLGRWRFVHDLVRQALYRSIPGSARARVHLLVGRALEQQQAHRPTPVDRLAHHFANAWPECTAADAAVHLRRAGDFAIRQLDLELAARFYDRALDLFAQEGQVEFDRLRSEIAIAAGQTRIELGQAEAARDSLHAVAMRARERGWSDVFVEATAALVNAWQGRPLPEATLELLRAAVATRVEQAHTAKRLLIGVLASMNPDEVESAVEEVLAGDDAAGAAELLTVLWRWQRPPLRLVRAREQIELGKRAGLTSIEAGAVVREWISLVEAGQGDLSERPLPAACYRDGGQLTTAQAITMLWTTAAATGRGDFATASASLARSQDAVPEIASAIRLRTPNVALLLDAQSLSLAAFEQPLTQSARYRAMRTSWAPDAKGLECFTALFAGLAGDTERAHQLCSQLVEQLRSGFRAASDWLAETAVTAEACGLAGHLEGVALCQELLAPHADHHVIIGASLYLGPVASRLAVAARAAGDIARALELFELAVTVAERAHARTHVVQGRLQLAAELRARGDAGGAAPLEALAQIEARELGLRVP